MKGLVKYDLMQLAGTSKKSFYLLYFVGLAAVGVMLGGGTIFSYMAVMIGCMTGVSFFSYESWYHWDSYCAVMPLSNRQIVVSRYISLLIVTGCGVLWGIVIGVLALAAGHNGCSRWCRRCWRRCYIWRLKFRSCIGSVSSAGASSTSCCLLSCSQGSLRWQSSTRCRRQLPLSYSLCSAWCGLSFCCAFRFPLRSPCVFERKKNIKKSSRCH